MVSKSTNEFKIIITLSKTDYDVWDAFQEDSKAPESIILEEVKSIEGVTDV